MAVGAPGRLPDCAEPEVDKQHVDKLDAKLPEFNKAGEAHGAADDKVTRSYSEAG